MTLDRDDILRLSHELNEVAMAAHALFETIEGLRTEIVDEVRKLHEKEGPICRCDLCDTDVPVLEAQTMGWSGVGKWKNGETAYLGICPTCIADPPGKPVKAPDAPQTPSRPKSGKPRTTLFPTDNEQ